MTREERRVRNQRAWKLLIAAVVATGIVDTAFFAPKRLSVRPVDPVTAAEQAANSELARCNKRTADTKLVWNIRQLIEGVPPDGHGYVCETIDLICESERSRRSPGTVVKGYSVSCDHQRYLYDVEDYGGKWTVVAR